VGNVTIRPLTYHPCMFFGITHPLDDASLRDAFLGRCVPGTMRPRTIHPLLGPKLRLPRVARKAQVSGSSCCGNGYPPPVCSVGSGVCQERIVQWV
jgi:hypothetical protein